MFIRRKHNIGPATLTALALVACAPLLLAFARILALPGGDSLPLANLAWLRGLGEWLSQHLTLEWMPPQDRGSVLYLLLLPTGALCITLARLTFGLRVLGLRAILIAIGFQAIGILPSLTLMLVVVGSVVLIRPWIRRIRLPLYARIGLILGLSALIMVCALLVAPWLGSETIWSVAFFPVIIMAMLAEGVAKTLERDDAVMAAWRTTWTIALAFIIALIDRTASQVNFRFPELIVTQLVAIVFIAECLDLRLLEDWPARLTRYFSGARPWYAAKPRIAIVRNRNPAGVIARLGRAAPRQRRQSLQPHVNALRQQGFEVKVFEGDTRLLTELAKFLRPDPRSGSPGGIVLNLATGLQGEGRLAHVPAMLELAGLPYSGPDPVAHARLADRFALLALLERAGVPVPRHVLATDPSESSDVELPAAVRPRFEPDTGREVVRTRRGLARAVARVHRDYGQAAVIEEVPAGRKITVTLLGNELIECLPLVEYERDGNRRICPAQLPESVADRVRAHARAAYRAAGCRDYGRVDLRVMERAEPVVVDVKWIHPFLRRGAFLTAANAGGHTLATVLNRIVTHAARRYVGLSRLAEEEPAPAETESRRGVTRRDRAVAP